MQVQSKPVLTATRGRAARMVRDPDVPVAVEASLVPEAPERLDAGLGAPLAPVRAGAIAAALAAGGPFDRVIRAQQAIGGSATLGFVGPAGQVALGLHRMPGGGLMPLVGPFTGQMLWAALPPLGAAPAEAEEEDPEAREPAAPLDTFATTVKVADLGLRFSSHSIKTYFPDTMTGAAPTVDCLQVVIGGAGLYAGLMKKGVTLETGANAVALGADVLAALGHAVPFLSPIAPHAKTVSMVLRFASEARELHLKLSD